MNDTKQRKPEYFAEPSQPTVDIDIKVNCDDTLRFYTTSGGEPRFVIRMPDSGPLPVLFDGEFVNWVELAGLDWGSMHDKLVGAVTKEIEKALVIQAFASRLERMK